MCMTLNSKIKCLKYVNYINIFDIPGLDNVRIDTIIMMFTTRGTKGHTQNNVRTVPF